jgi:hypothetical protein
MLPAFPVCELLMLPVLGLESLLFAEPEFVDSALEVLAADPALAELLLAMD